MISRVASLICLSVVFLIPLCFPVGPAWTAPLERVQNPDSTQQTEKASRAHRFGLGGSFSIGSGRSLEITSGGSETDFASAPAINAALHLAWESLTLGIGVSISGTRGTDEPGFGYAPLQGWLSYGIYHFAGIRRLAVVPAIGVGKGQVKIEQQGEQHGTTAFDIATMDATDFSVGVSVGWGNVDLKGFRGRDARGYVALSYTYSFSELDNLDVVATDDVPLAQILRNPGTEVSLGRHMIMLTASFSILFL